jgi:hypothetical protein
MTKQKLKVYPDIICLEMDSPEGIGWWYSGVSLAFTPINVRHIRKVKYVILEGTRKPLLVVMLPIDGQERMAAINLPRSDTNALKEKGMWHPDIKAPYSEIIYTPTPKRKTYHP